jgi:hypothetical protein
MVKQLLVSDDDPGIAVTLEWTPPGTPGRARGWHGTCTECGPAWSMHRWNDEAALTSAHRHIDLHQAVATTL